ncbi:hypothetical protein EIN_376580 [Entamoeba invadens IP1]|uniref:Uncharacterized protein n=1 Tax=Entamoeba invadens IP1 TaxID=370355 RepID=A0A0A1TW24_ENTIV|nr:hypothetical protein EIN_376580 [Entamoeba invadens IP1]ELP83483.1 hypothetical protein EIN_376580 [Entamoeba invadens IP1]|eukprot:XP_004182829.1 hypothetical protein EIN_376580 [Entamoeba invadens IP1]
MLRSKYKKNLYALLDEKEFNVSAFNRLHHNMELAPVKLPKVFRILEDYITKNITVEANVIKATKTMGELSLNCRDQLSLIDQSMIRVIRQCVNSTVKKVKLAGVQLLDFYTKACNENSVRTNFEEIKKIPNDLTKMVGNNEEIKSCLTALRDCVVIFQMVNELDQILGYNTVLRVIFDSLTNSDGNEEITTQAKEIVLKIVTSISDKITTVKFIVQFSEFLDKNEKWSIPAVQSILGEFGVRVKPIISEVIIQTVLEHIPKSDKIASKIAQLNFVKKSINNKVGSINDNVRRLHGLLDFPIVSQKEFDENEAKPFIEMVFDLICECLTAITDDLIKADFCFFIFGECDQTNQSKTFLNTLLLFKITGSLKKEVLQRVDKTNFVKFLSNFNSTNSDIRHMTLLVVRQFLFGKELEKSSKTYVFSQQIKMGLVEMLQQPTSSEDIVEIYKFWRDMILTGQVNELLETIPLLGYVTKKSVKSNEKQQGCIHYVTIMLLKIIGTKYNIEGLNAYTESRLKGISSYFEVSGNDLKAKKVEKDREDVKGLLLIQKDVCDIIKNSDVAQEIDGIEKIDEEISLKNRAKHKVMQTNVLKQSSMKTKETSKKSVSISNEISFNMLKEIATKGSQKKENESEVSKLDITVLLTQAEELKKDETEMLNGIDSLLECDIQMSIPKQDELFNAHSLIPFE